MWGKLALQLIARHVGCIQIGRRSSHLFVSQSFSVVRSSRLIVLHSVAWVVGRANDLCTDALLLTGWTCSPEYLFLNDLPDALTESF
jgi:hypothetical protein